MNPLKRGANGRLQSRKGAASAPAPLDALARTPAPGDYAEFLRVTLPRQEKNVASHRFGSERVWLKKAGPRHGKWGYRVMAAVARMVRLDIIKPVPNPGGEAAIATEARRLKQLAAAGLRVPVVLAQQADGLLISDLGESGRATVVLQERLDQAAAAGPAALLAVWREGLAAIAAVHVRGQHLSQAFDRNLVQCSDGTIGYIDFEDDPAEVMTLAECQARDWLSYLHSTAMMLEAAAPQAAGQQWHAALAGVSDEVRERIANAARRMKWAQKLPASRRWGRDTQRVRAVARLLGRWHLA
jgi:tRNA A-37 threonylcarbamoyl transferase component Bud32